MFSDAGVTPVAGSADASRYTSLCPHWEAPRLVRDLVPVRYGAFVRVLPPLQGGGASDSGTTRWSDILAPDELAPGRVVKALDDAVARSRLTATPLIGHFDSGTAARLVEHLADETPDDELVVYLYWGGRAFLTELQYSFGFDASAAHPAFQGPVSALARLAAPWAGFVQYESPTAWWPSGESWWGAMHTDSVALYLGGRVAEAIAADPELDATMVSPDALLEDWVAL